MKTTDIYKKKYWYFSPVLLWRFFKKEREETRFYFLSLSAWEKKQFKKEKRRHLISLFISMTLHGLLFFGVYNSIYNNYLIEGEDIAITGEEVNFELLKGMTTDYLQPLYDKNSTIIIDHANLLSRRSRGDNTALNLDKLLAGLKSSSSPNLSSSSQKTAEQGSHLKGEEQALQKQLKIGQQGATIGRRMRYRKAKLWNRVQLLRSGAGSTGKSLNYSEIMRVIDAHSFYFRDCYEKSLLQDETLSIKAVFILRLNQDRVRRTQLNLHGDGNPQSRRSLTRCLIKHTKTLVFAKNKRNMSVKFNLIFGL